VTAAYLLAAILGVGLLLFSSFGGGEHGSDGGDVSDLGDGHSGGEAAEASHVLIGLFNVRNFTFFLAAFGTTGLLLTALDAGSTRTPLLATVLGLVGFALSHAVFTWLRRSDASVEAPADRDFEGSLGRVVLPVTSEGRGQIACMIAGRESYLTATLADGVTQPLVIGQEVIIVSSSNGIAHVMPATSLELPSPT
jgi:membrane protein implicated in regulation of membrane protease activity